MESPEELEAKLANYQAQLAQVDALLAADPASEQVLKLKTDLEQVITLTQDLLDVAQTSEEAGAGAGAPYAPLPPAEVRGASAAANSGDAFSVGSRVEALSRDTWYPAVIKAVSDDTQSFTISYMGFGGEDTKTLASMRLITLPPQPVSAEEARRGLKCRGLYLGDLQWYDCVIEGTTEHGYKVLFTQYGNREELPLEYLQKASEAAAAAPAADAGAKARTLPKAARAEDGSFKIPDNLRLASTDSEADRIRKRNKVKALKQLYKQELVEEETMSKQNSWKAFASKGTKRVAGSMKGLRKESIFKSPEGLEGKVGVVGSGQGMTTFDNRKKFKRP